MEKPRPSPNFGKFTSTRATCGRRSATAAGSSVGSRRRTNGVPASAGTTRSLGCGELSVTTRRCLINAAIDVFLERRDADAVHHVDEALGVAIAVAEVALDQALDHVGHLGARERGTDDFAKCGLRATRAYLALVAADLDLVPLVAILVDAEDTDMADVVVAAGVHAARDVQVEIADIVQVVEVVELALDGFGDRNGLGVGEGAEVAARAADDVGEEAEVRRVETQQPHLVPERHELVLAHVGEHQVLLVRHAQLAE